MSEEKDEVSVTFKLTRNTNGTINTGYSIVGGGFYYYEIIGLIQMASYNMAAESCKIAKEIPDRPTRMRFDEPKKEDL